MATLGLMAVDGAARQNGIPGLPTPDSSLGFLRDGYLFGTRRFERVRGDAFRTRLLGQPVTVMRGADAARTFYEGGRFGRERAMPASVLHLLQDDGSVQSLDGTAHLERKRLFLEQLSTTESLERARRLLVEEWPAIAGDHVVLYERINMVLTRVALRWVGINPDRVDLPALTTQLTAMIENAGRFGPENWAARTMRRSTEAWARRVVAAERTALTGHDTILGRISSYTEDGDVLSPEVAAVELLNVLRPTVAIGRYIVFAALALHRRPGWRRAFASGELDRIRGFVDEVRRFYPFFPVIGGRALRGFTWHGHDFRTGDWVLLDLYGTNHDERLWPDAGRFQPKRFDSFNGDRNALIPQGGGEQETGHRCPGEQATIDLMEQAVVLLATTHYRVPEQDLRVSLRHFPALPESGFIMEGVRA